MTNPLLQDWDTPFRIAPIRWSLSSASRPSATSMPPKTGMAMGIMTSAPRPVEVRTGRRARIVVADVIRAGRARLRPA